jgi:hypothetical protein
LVRQAQKGDIGAFEELVARHRDKLFTRVMGCSIGAVTSKLLYARRKIAALLDN